jgi:geranylgeranylglycerol-phosphate geranylgeranyltransferase
VTTKRRASTRSNLRKLLGLIEVTRPENCLMAGLLTVVGAQASTGSGSGTGSIVFAAMAVALTVGFGNSINDAVDVEADRVSKPWRPIPSGRVGRREVQAGAGFLAASAALCSANVSAVFFFLDLAMIGGAFAYSWRLKRVPIWGHVLVALQTGLVLLGGTLAAHSRHPVPPMIIYGAAMVACGVLALEIAKTFPDREADAAVGITTVAHRLSPSSGRALFAFLMSAYAVLAVLTSRGLESWMATLALYLPMVPYAIVIKSPQVASYLRSARMSKALWPVTLGSLFLITAH